MKTTESKLKELNNHFDCGLVKGLGEEKKGKMCVMAAVSLVMDGKFTDKPSCVGEAVRETLIRINDASWSDNEARAKGIRRAAICSLGSVDIDQIEFSERLALETIRQIIPDILRRAGLDDHAEKCENVETIHAAAHAADAAAYAAHAADAAAYAARVAAHDAAYAAADAAADARDSVLSKFCSIIELTLTGMVTEGSKMINNQLQSEEAK